MNIILVLVDSLNRHVLEPYATGQDGRRADTPNLARFAERAWRFDNHFVGSLPCMPARRELTAGFSEFMWRPWGPLEPFDLRLPKLLERAGYSTGLITDHYHYWEEAGNGYLQGFASTELIRGHEGDNWHLATPPDAAVPEWVSSIEKWRPGGGPRQYHANVAGFKSEEDFFAPKVMRAGADWLRTNADRAPFFAQIESFDVHEPFHVPEPYRSLYYGGDDPEKHTLWPPYQDPRREAAFVDQASEADRAFVRDQYRGKVTMLDTWFGELLDTFDEQDLWDDSVIIVTTDHGHDLCERGSFGKQYPHYDTHANIPLLVWDPRHPGGGRGIADLTTTVDLFATILDVAGVPVPPGTHGVSLLPLLAGDRSRARRGVLYGTFGQGVCCTDGEWTVFKSPEADGPLYYYSAAIFRSLHVDGRVSPSDTGYFIPGVELPQWKVPVSIEPRCSSNFLFHRREDPGQTRNRWDTDPEARERMLALLRELLGERGAPAEQYERLGLDPARQGGRA